MGVLQCDESKFFAAEMDLLDAIDYLQTGTIEKCVAAGKKTIYASQISGICDQISKVSEKLGEINQVVESTKIVMMAYFPSFKEKYVDASNKYFSKLEDNGELSDDLEIRRVEIYNSTNVSIVYYYEEIKKQRPLTEEEQEVYDAAIYELGEGTNYLANMDALESAYNDYDTLIANEPPKPTTDDLLDCQEKDAAAGLTWDGAYPPSYVAMSEARAKWENDVEEKEKEIVSLESSTYGFEVKVKYVYGDYSEEDLQEEHDSAKNKKGKGLDLETKIANGKYEVIADVKAQKDVDNNAYAQADVIANNGLDADTGDYYTLVQKGATESTEALKSEDKDIMTNNQHDWYCYLFATEGEDSANEYLESLKRVNNIEKNKEAQQSKAEERAKREKKTSDWVAKMDNNPKSAEAIAKGKNMVKGMVYGPATQNRPDTVYVENQHDMAGRYMRQLEPEQKDVYYYIVATEGFEAGQAYLEMFKDDVIYDEGVRLANSYDGTVGVGFDSGLRNFFGGISRAITKDTSYSVEEVAAEVYRNDVLTEDEQEVFDFSAGAGQMVPIILLSAYTGMAGGGTGAVIAQKAITGTVMGISSYGNNYTQMIRSGYTEEQAHEYAWKSATAEATIEMAMGNIPGGATVGNGIKGTVFAYVKDMAEEALEEVIQNKVSTAIHNDVTGENIDLGFSQEDLEIMSDAAILSGIIGGVQRVPGGISAVSTYVSTNQAYSTVVNNASSINVDVNHITNNAANINFDVTSNAFYPTSINTSTNQVVNTVNSGDSSQLYTGLGNSDYGTKKIVVQSLDEKTSNNFVNNLSDAEIANLPNTIGMMNMDALIIKLSPDNVARIFNNVDNDTAKKIYNSLGDFSRKYVNNLYSEDALRLKVGDSYNVEYDVENKSVTETLKEVAINISNAFKVQKKVNELAMDADSIGKSSLEQAHIESTTTNVENTSNIETVELNQNEWTNLINGLDTDNFDAKGNSKKCYYVEVNGQQYALLAYNMSETDMDSFTRRRNTLDDLIAQGLDTPAIVDYHYDSENNIMYELQEKANGTELFPRNPSEDREAYIDHINKSLELLSNCSNEQFQNFLNSLLVMRKNGYKPDTNPDNFFIDENSNISLIDVNINYDANLKEVSVEDLSHVSRVLSDIFSKIYTRLTVDEKVQLKPTMENIAHNWLSSVYDFMKSNNMSDTAIVNYLMNYNLTYFLVEDNTNIVANVLSEKNVMIDSNIVLENSTSEVTSSDVGYGFSISPDLDANVTMENVGVSENTVDNSNSAVMPDVDFSALNENSSSIIVGGVTLNFSSQNVLNSLKSDLNDAGISMDNLKNGNLTSEQVSEVCDMLAYYLPKSDNLQNFSPSVISNLNTTYSSSVNNLSVSDVDAKVTAFNEYVHGVSDLIVGDKNITTQIENIINNQEFSNSSVNEVDYSLTYQEKNKLVELLFKTNNLSDSNAINSLDYEDKQLIYKFLNTGAAKTLFTSTSQQIESLGYYMGTNFRIINSYLDTGVDSTYFGRPTSEIVSDIETVMNNNTLDSMQILQRAATTSDFNGLSLDEVIGQILVSNRFKSTCISDLSNVGTQNGGIAIGEDTAQKVKIDYVCPAGTKAVNLGMVTGNQVESEVLIGNNQRIRYDAITMDGDVPCILAVVLPEGVSSDVNIKDLVTENVYQVISSKYDLDTNVEVKNINISETTNSNIDINEIIRTNELMDLPEVLTNLTDEQLKESMFELDLSNMNGFFNSVENTRIASILESMSADEANKYINMFSRDSSQYFLQHFNTTFFEKNIGSFSDDSVLKLVELLKNDSNFAYYSNSPKHVALNSDAFISKITDTNNLELINKVFAIGDLTVNHLIIESLNTNELANVVKGNESNLSQAFSNRVFIDEAEIKKIYPIVENNSNLIDLKTQFQEAIAKFNYSIKLQDSNIEVSNNTFNVTRTNGTKFSLTPINEYVINGVKVTAYSYLDLASGKSFMIFDSMDALNSARRANTNYRNLIIDNYFSLNNVENSLCNYLGNYGFNEGNIIINKNQELSDAILAETYKDQFKFYFGNDNLSEIDLVDMFAKTFENAFDNNTQDEIDIFKAFIRLKLKIPQLSIRNIDDTVSSWNSSTNLINITLKDKNIEALGTIAHESGHAMWDLILNENIPGKSITEISDLWKKAQENASHKNNDGQRNSLALEQYIYNIELSAKRTARNNVNEHVKSIGKIRYYLEEFRKNVQSLKAEGKFKLIDAINLTRSARGDAEHQEKWKIIESDTPAMTAISDILSAVFYGENSNLNNENIYTPVAHNYSYYNFVKDIDGNVMKDSQGNPIKATEIDKNVLAFHEVIANFSELKRLNATTELNFLKEVFGEEFYNILEGTYQEFVKYGRNM